MDKPLEFSAQEMTQTRRHRRRRRRRPMASNCEDVWVLKGTESPDERLSSTAHYHLHQHCNHFNHTNCHRKRAYLTVTLALLMMIAIASSLTLTSSARRLPSSTALNARDDANAPFHHSAHSIPFYLAAGGDLDGGHEHDQPVAAVLELKEVDQGALIANESAQDLAAANNKKVRREVARAPGDEESAAATPATRQVKGDKWPPVQDNTRPPPRRSDDNDESAAATTAADVRHWSGQAAASASSARKPLSRSGEPPGADYDFGFEPSDSGNNEPASESMGTTAAAASDFSAPADIEGRRRSSAEGEGDEGGFLPPLPPKRRLTPPDSSSSALMEPSNLAAASESLASLARHAGRPSATLRPPPPGERLPRDGRKWNRPIAASAAVESQAQAKALAPQGDNEISTATTTIEKSGDRQGDKQQQQWRPSAGGAGESTLTQRAPMAPINAQENRPSLTTTTTTTTTRKPPPAQTKFSPLVSQAATAPQGVALSPTSAKLTSGSTKTTATLTAPLSFKVTIHPRAPVHAAKALGQVSVGKPKLLVKGQRQAREDEEEEAENDERGDDNKTLRMFTNHFRYIEPRKLPSAASGKTVKSTGSAAETKLKTDAKSDAGKKTSSTDAAERGRSPRLIAAKPPASHYMNATATNSTAQTPLDSNDNDAKTRVNQTATSEYQTNYNASQPDNLERHEGVKSTRKRAAWNLVALPPLPPLISSAVQKTRPLNDNQQQHAAADLFRALVAQQTNAARLIVPLASQTSATNKISPKLDEAPARFSSFSSLLTSQNNQQQAQNSSSATAPLILHLPLGNYVSPNYASQQQAITSELDNGETNGKTQQTASGTSDGSIVRSGFILPHHSHHHFGQQPQASGRMAWPAAAQIPLQNLRTLVPAAVALLAQAQGHAESGGGSPTLKQLRALNQLRSLLAGNSQPVAAPQTQVQATSPPSLDYATSSVAQQPATTVVVNSLGTKSVPSVGALTTAPSEPMLATSNQLGVSHLGPSGQVNGEPQGGANGGGGGYNSLQDYADSRPPPPQVNGGGGGRDERGELTGSGGNQDPQANNESQTSGGGGNSSNSPPPPPPPAPPGVSSSERSEDQRLVQYGGGHSPPNDQMYSQQQPDYYDAPPPPPRYGGGGSMNGTGGAPNYYGAASSSHEYYQQQNARSSPARNQQQQQQQHELDSYLRAEHKNSLDPFEELTSGPLGSSEYERDLADLDEEFNRHAVFRPMRPSGSSSNQQYGSASSGLMSDSMLAYSPERYESPRGHYNARRPSSYGSYLTSGGDSYGSPDYLSASASIIPRPHHHHHHQADAQHHHHHHHHNQQQQAQQQASYQRVAQPPSYLSSDASELWATDPTGSYAADFSPLASFLAPSAYATSSVPQSYRWRPRYATAATSTSSARSLSPYASLTTTPQLLASPSGFLTSAASSDQPTAATQYNFVPTSYAAALPTETVSFTMSPLAAAAAAAATALAAADKTRHNHHAWTFTLPRLASALTASQFSPSSSSSSNGGANSGGSTAASSHHAHATLASPFQAAIQFHRPTMPTAAATSSAAAATPTYLFNPFTPIYAIGPRPPTSPTAAAPLSAAASGSAASILQPYALHPAAAAAAAYTPIIAYRPAPLLTTASFAYPFRLPIGGPAALAPSPFAAHHAHHHHHLPGAYSSAHGGHHHGGSTGSKSTGSGRLVSAASSTTSSSGSKPFLIDLQFAESKSKSNSPGNSNNNNKDQHETTTTKGLVIKSASGLTQMARNLTKKMFGSASQVRPQFAAPPANFDSSSSSSPVQGAGAPAPSTSHFTSAAGGNSHGVHQSASAAAAGAAPPVQLASS